MSILSGKGFFIWKIRDCRGGDAEAIAAAAQSAGYTHVLIKIADGTYTQNFDRTNNVDLCPPVIQALRNRGIQAWGWHYVYGDDPLGEAQMAIQRLSQLNLQGYVIDAESEYKEPGRDVAAAQFMTQMRAAYPSLPMALSSYRFPSYHAQFPWSAFLNRCDLNMPQVYWEQAHNPADQLDRSVRELTALTPSRPVIPTGPTYQVSGWAPSQQEITDFLNKARQLGLSAANFFSWDECERDLPALWNTISGYNWNSEPVFKDIVDQYIYMLNTHDASRVRALYRDDAVLTVASQTVQGPQSLLSYYTYLLNTILPNATFTQGTTTGTGTNRQFNWTAVTSRGKVSNGNDTFGLMDGKIIYHYSYFTLTP